jgi:MoxR-like ATPase
MRALLADALHFARLQELFGPLSLRALEADQYVRQTAGYLPEASVAFIDEARVRQAAARARLTLRAHPCACAHATPACQVFKANSAVLNSLLTILNERLFDNGNTRVPVPLLCLVGASNELPDSEELDALYDRFLLRCAVAQVSDAGVDTLLALPARNGDGGDGDGHHATDDGDGGTPQLQLRAEALAGVRRAAAGVEVPPDIRGLLKELRSHLQNLQPPVYVSGARNGACVSCVSCSMLTH